MAWASSKPSLACFKLVLGQNWTLLINGLGLGLLKENSKPGPPDPTIFYTYLECGFSPKRYKNTEKVMEQPGPI